MNGRALCLLGIHSWVPIAWLTCNSADLGNVCRRCFKEGPRLYPAQADRSPMRSSRSNIGTVNAGWLASFRRGQMGQWSALSLNLAAIKHSLLP
jgi:hypothetical protein